MIHNISGSAYETTINEIGRIKLPVEHMMHLGEAYERGTLVVGPHMMDSGYSSIVGLHGDRTKAEEVPIRELEFSMSDRNIVISDAKNLLNIQGDRIIVVGNFWSVDFWNPQDWNDLYSDKKKVFDEKIYDYLLGVKRKSA